jgi:thymidylate synthase (FAD)
MLVQLVWMTPDAQHMIAKCARVSNPTNQENRVTEEKLLKYLATHKHWSPFEMASMCLEITTSRAISAQILRHRSFHFQEFSQRYAAAQTYEIPYFRLQDEKNRQNSLDTISDEVQAQLQQQTSSHLEESFKLYDTLVQQGVAKECARMVLPLCTETTIYMCGTIRDWIHYCQVRCAPDTQKEHREVAEECRRILLENLPALSKLFE